MPEFDLRDIEPLTRPGIQDYHVHCDYSIDATGTIEEYCEAALARNLTEICFTTHFDANPNSDGRVNFIHVDGEHIPATIDNLKPYVDHVTDTAQSYYLRGLSVKLGVEFGYFIGADSLANKLKETYPFDYFLCGIHEIDNICYCCRKTYQACFERFGLEEAVEKYFSQVEAAIRSNLFDCIAHLDYYVKYATDFYGEAVRSAHEPHLFNIFELLKAYDTGLEINTSGIRHGGHDYYPRMELVNLAKKAGVSIIHIGSDAHRPQDIGYEFELAAALVPDTISGSED